MDETITYMGKKYETTTALSFNELLHESHRAYRRYTESPLWTNTRDVFKAQYVTAHAAVVARYEEARKDTPDAEPHSQGAGETSQASETEDQSAS